MVSFHFQRYGGSSPSRLFPRFCQIVPPDRSTLRLTSRESQELSIQCLQCFGKIHTKTIGSVLVGRREKTDEVEIKRATRDTRLVKSEVERVVRVWCCRCRSKGEVVLNPLVGRGVGLHLCGSESLVVDVRLQGSGEAAFVRSLDPEGTSVVLDLDTNAPVSTMMRQWIYLDNRPGDLTCLRIQPPSR
jgi:hypothetical protein